ncbi:hypothetical protein [Ruminococcus sp. XPD3002]|uniref:hypothetical protein n=1 Tax=Ruminococcus sp. XPD3002 TaxID=1452269 RepID=UPI00091EB42A|nr:hypothetical protein SAMN04487832_11952 [Ruminococcus flavefaciens]
MKIEKLSNKIEFNVEAQKAACNADCPAGFTFVGNTALISLPNLKTCFVKPLWSSFISPSH